MKKRNLLMFACMWLLVMVIIAATTMVLLFSDEESGHLRWLSREEYEIVERYARLEAVRSEITKNYVIEPDQQALMEGAINGMLSVLGDPYTFYYTPDAMRSRSVRSEGEYSGIGLVVQNNEEGLIEIVRVYEESPANEAGVQAGDLILEIDGQEVDGVSTQTLNEALEMMRGEAGESVLLTLRRSGEILERSIPFGEVRIDNVTSAMLEGNIGYIDIIQFEGDAAERFEKILKAFESAGAKGLVLDLRNNPGGILDHAVHIADCLLPEGTVVYTEDRSGKRTDYYSDARHTELPLVVLINDMSASASEILAAAVQDNDRGTVVGIRSFGKGIVQTLVEFEGDGAGMQYTSSYYFTPSGRSIHGKGVAPDVEVETGEGFIQNYDVPDIQRDLQLKNAVDILLQEIE